ncbi:MAG: ATP-dependent Clp protease ATP-binding subunit [Candidatus Nomurabacteria bacterium]|nr:MAG: ATP-dependent Clp protease ATP-binding subunit [Candidatus Nomurabacteria bacterium]
MEKKPPLAQKFTTHLKATFEQASRLSADLRHVFLNPEHLLYGLLESRGGIAAEILNKAGVEAEILKSFIIERNEPLSPDLHFTKEQVKFSLPAKRATEKAALIAKEHGHKYIGTEHLLLGLLQLNDPTLERYFNEHAIKLKEIQRQVYVVLRSTTKFPDLTGFFEVGKEEALEAGIMGDPNQQKGSALEFFTTELTNSSLQKGIDPVIGREGEIDRLMNILSRRTKNNPVLIGDPGVGKTAIVEGLAKKIMEKQVPDALRNKRLLSLDMSLLVAGTMYRGEFESRLRQVIEEIKADPNIILFIDELHTIVGTGSASGSMDAANILKPALAKGNVRCIGATTLDEYRKHIEADAALERRFQPIIVDEPTPEETIKILQGIKRYYEQYHRVHITDDAVQAAVQMSVRYIQDKFLPDKAIDLIDEAASKQKVLRKKSPLMQQYEEIENRLQELEQVKNASVQSENFAEAVKARNEELQLRKRLEKLQEKIRLEESRYEGTVDTQKIAEVISRATGIPLEDLVKEEKERLLNLEALLKEHIVGQDEAIKSVSSFIRRSRVGLSHPSRPIASFLFLGPSGIGKTETAKKIAEIVFKDPKALIRIDMSEYGESFNTSKLLGAPAGYVGYKDQNTLTDQIRRKPYSVLLLDEIEKAHPDIFNVFLQVLDDGHLTDASGRRVNFKNTIIIMTSNIGIAELQRAASLGFATSAKEEKSSDFETEYQRIKEQVLHEVEREFRPEFLNRLDEIIVFRPLNPEQVIEIVRLQMKELRQRLEEQHISIKLTRGAEEFIAQTGFKPEFGARAVRRVIQEHIENALAAKLLDGSIQAGAKVTVGARNGQLTFTT